MLSNLLLAFFKRILLLNSLSLFSVFAYSQGNGFSINRSEPTWKTKIIPQEKRPAAKDISDGFFLSFYENQNHVELQEDYNHVIRDIVSDAGVQNGSQISIAYDPGFQKLIFHKVIVWRNGLASDRLKASGFKILQSEKELSRFIYSGTYDALMVLDDVRKGDKIEFAYTIKGFNPIYGKKYAALYYFEGQSSIGHIYSNVIFNKSRDLDYRNLNFNDPPKITEAGNLKMYEWESTLTKTHRTSDFEPTWFNPFRRTQLSEYNSWSEVVDWGLSVNDYPNLQTPILNKKVSELEAIAGNDLEKYIQLATRFVQDEIRYMGIEIGAYSHRPNSPEKVLVQRYGDCKDKSLLLVTLLKARGIDAYMTYVDTYNTLKTTEYLPSPFIFNHVIVMVDYNKRKTWIDPTIAYQRGKFDDFYAPNYGNVLVIRKGVNALEKIDSKPKGKLISSLTFKLADTVAESKSTLNIFSIYTDNYADDIRAQIAESGADNMEKTFLEYYAKLYPGIEILENIVIDDDEEANILEIKESYEISDMWNEQDESKNKLAYFYGDLIRSELRAITDKKRKSPVALKHFINVEQNITVELPYSLEHKDESFKVENEDYLFDVYMDQTDSTVKFSYTYQNLSDHIDESNLKNYIKDVKKIDEYLTYTLSRGTWAGDSGGLNWYMTGAYLFSIVVTGLICLKLYLRINPFDIDELVNALPIGGWVAVLAIRVVVFPISILIKPFTLGIFGTALWNNISVLSGSEAILKTAYILESVLFASIFMYSLFCAVLFFQRRQEFPKHFITLSISYLIFAIIDAALGAYISEQNNVPIILAAEVGSFIGALVVCVAAILYLVKSQRVKQTFVFTYPQSAWQLAISRYFQNSFTNKQENNDENI